jgi:hypothetical protein
MELFIKFASRHYERLLAAIPAGSPAHQAIGKATPIEHSVGGVEFEGYTIPCDENQARIILGVARQCCPEIVRDIEEALAQGKS